MTLDVMDKHELFKERYLVMDNAPIHKHTDIKSYIESRGYGCVYLPPYSPELNPIEQFWSVCKSKLKREALLEEETLTSRIKFACNNVLISDLRDFCKYSVAKFSDCLKKTHLIKINIWYIWDTIICANSIFISVPKQFRSVFQFDLWK